LPVVGFFFREYNRYSPDLSFLITLITDAAKRRDEGSPRSRLAHL